MTDALAYYTTNLVYFPLPYHSVGAFYSQERVQGGSISYVSKNGVPYGLYARLAITALTNLAAKADNEGIVTFSIYELLKSARANIPNGKQLAKFENQLISWCTTTITISYTTANRKSYENLLLVSAASFGLKKNMAKNSDSFIKFSAEGKEFLLSTSLPIPLEAVRNINQAFDFDTLAWLITSTFTLRRKGKEYQQVYWSILLKQFSYSRNNSTNFRRSFCEALFRLKQKYYPEARVERSPDGLIIYNSPLLTSRRMRLQPIEHLEETEK